MIPTPATVSETAGDPGEGRGEDREDLPERLHHRVLRQDGDVLLAVVPVRAGPPGSPASPRRRRAPSAPRRGRGRRSAGRTSGGGAPIGIRTTSSRSRPSETPRGARTPVTRNFSSPSRSISPSGERPGKSSSATFAPMTQTRGARDGSPGGMKVPSPQREPPDVLPLGRHPGDGQVAAPLAEPGREPARRRAGPPRTRVDDAPPERLDVVERQVVRDAAATGTTPVVSALPGRTMTRFEPRRANSPVT